MAMLGQIDDWQYVYLPEIQCQQYHLGQQ